MTKRRKTGGRTKGTPNRITQELREVISSFLCKNFSKIENDFDKLQPKDRAKVYCDLLQYGLPKMRDLEHRITHNEKINRNVFEKGLTSQNETPVSGKSPD